MAKKRSNKPAHTLSPEPVGMSEGHPLPGGDGECPKEISPEIPVKEPGTPEPAAERHDSDSSVPDQGSFPAEVVADLAVKLLQLKSEKFRQRLDNSKFATDWTLDLECNHAVKRAKAILRLASEQTDEEIHAYQLFSKSSDPMSFADIAKTFKEAGWKWMVHPQTVTTKIEEILDNANMHILPNIELIENDLKAHLGYPVDWALFERRLTRYLRTMFVRTPLGPCVGDIEPAVDFLVKNILRQLMEKRESSLGKSRPDLLRARSEYSSFMTSVCNGHTFEEFTGKKALSKLSVSTGLTLLALFMEDPELYTPEGMGPEHVLFQFMLNFHEACLENIVTQHLDMLIGGKSGSPEAQKYRESVISEVETIRDYFWLQEFWELGFCDGLLEELRYINNKFDESVVQWEGWLCCQE